MDKSRRAQRGARFITTGERIGGFIGWAFVLAIALHAILIPFVRPPDQATPTGQQPYRTTIAQLATAPPPTTPPATPTPPPERQPQRAASSLRAPIPRLHNSIGRPEPPVQGTTGPMTVVSPLTQSASPAPAATVAAACPDPNRDAHTLSLAPPEYPPSAQEEDAGGRQVQVAVTIAPNGRVVEEAIVASSGIEAIDQDALRVARETTYAPRVKNCLPVLGTYKYVIDYNSG
jgi:TonB family protein